MHRDKGQGKNELAKCFSCFILSAVRDTRNKSKQKQGRDTSRKLEAETGAESREDPAHWHVPQAHSHLFVAPRNTCPVAVLSLVAWAFPYKSLNDKKNASHTYLQASYYSELRMVDKEKMRLESGCNHRARFAWGILRDYMDSCSSNLLLICTAED